MQGLFYNSGYILRMIDVIPGSMESESASIDLGTPSVTRSAATGLENVHCNNLVNTGCSPQFPLSPIPARKCTATRRGRQRRIYGLGPSSYVLPMSPVGQMSLTSHAQYLHPFQAHASFVRSAMFDSLRIEGSPADNENAFWAAIVQDFNLRSLEYCTFLVSHELLPLKDKTGTELDHWPIRLLNLGIPKYGVCN